MYVIAGATGNTGSAVAEKLLADGREVLALGRSAEKLRMLEEKGAQTLALDLTDTKKLTDAFRGAEGVYMMTPPNFGAEKFIRYVEEVTDSFMVALEETRVPYVVFLSSIGAQLSGGTGLIKGLHRAENKLATLEGTNVLSIRAGNFMENFFMSINGIKQQGVFGSLVNGSIPLPTIAARDIGEYAAKRLEAKDFTGMEFRELHGERDLRMTEVAKVLGTAIGKPDLPFQQFPEEAMREPMKAMGASDDAINEYFEMSRGFSSGQIHAQEKRGPENTTATSIEAFAQVFAQVYNNS